MSTSKPDSETNPLRSVYTSNLPDILAQLNISLVVSTYQAGKVVLVRNDGDTINTHFRNFQKPMGLAVHQNRLTIGGAKNIWYLRNMPAVAQKLDPPGKHDACYLPRRVHVTIVPVNKLELIASWLGLAVLTVIGVVGRTLLLGVRKGKP